MQRGVGGSPARSFESLKPRPTNAAVLREWIACSAISFSRSKFRVKRALPARRKHKPASARTSAMAG
jgi:hypothetical protein